MNIKYDFSNEEEYVALEDMMDGLTVDEISAVHKTVLEFREEKLADRKKEVRQRFEQYILPILVAWAKSAHATLEIKEENELYYEVTFVSVYGFNVNREKWKRSLLALADEINMEVFNDSVLLELIFCLKVE